MTAVCSLFAYLDTRGGLNIANISINFSSSYLEHAEKDDQRWELCRINVGSWASIYTVKSNGQDTPSLYPHQQQDDDRN